jgi:hypothetical protein
MAIDVTVLKNAGWSTTAEEVTERVNAELRAAVRPRGRVRASEVMSPAELASWREMGVDLDRAYERIPAAVDTAAAMAALYASSLTPAEAAAVLGVDRSRISHRLAKGTLYAFKVDGHPRLPRFQFTDDLSAVVPNFVQVAPHLVDIYPLAVANWFTLPDDDLRVGEDETPVSPRIWLLEGRDPAPVVESATWLKEAGLW